MNKAKKLIKSIIRRAETMFSSNPANDINRRAISEEAKEALTELQNEEARIKELEQTLEAKRTKLRMCKDSGYCGQVLEKMYEAECKVQELEAENEKMKEAINHWFSCVDAANAEGLQEAIRDTDDEKLKDLLVRRLFYDTTDTFEKARKESGAE